MNKLIFTLSAAMLLNSLAVQSMEPTSDFAKASSDRSLYELRRTGKESNKQNNSDCPLPDFKLEDELIFACCVIQKTVPIESKKALEDTIKNFIHVRSTCKKYYEFLTYEKIGNFCKNYSTFAKNVIFHEINALPSINFHCRPLIPLILILIHADAKFQNHQDKLLENAIYNSDAYMLKTLLKHGLKLNQRKIYGNDPFIFSAKTVEIAEILMNNGIDIHASRNTGYNFLSDLLRRSSQCSWTHKNRFLSDGTEFSFEEGNVEYIRPTRQSTWELIEFCLQHNVAMSDEDHELYNKFTTQQNIANDNLTTHDSMPQKETTTTSKEKKEPQSCIIF